jgi:hypothetical protein
LVDDFIAVFKGLALFIEYCITKRFIISDVIPLLMALYEKKWWKKMFKKEHHEAPIDAVEDVQAVANFLLDIEPEKVNLIKLLGELEELEQERKVAASGVLQINLQAQAKLMEKILQSYADFQNDVDINGLRVKKVAKNFLREAEKAGMKDLVKEKKHDPKWMFWW